MPNAGLSKARDKQKGHTFKQEKKGLQHRNFFKIKFKFLFFLYLVIYVLKVGENVNYKNGKMSISTSVWHAQHQHAGRNIQHGTLNGFYENSTKVENKRSVALYLFSLKRIK